jgi:hypothetical protein
VSHAASPVPARVGQPVQLSIVVADPAARHKSVRVYHRPPGQKSYSTVTALRTSAGKYTAIISGQFVKAAGLEYYIEVLDPKGKVLTAEGNAKGPLEVAMTTTTRRSKAAPIYARWWFWTGVGAVLLGGTLLALSAGGGDSGSTDATVVITVNPPETP